MAERRMFARAIVNSARFLQLSARARLLYYDLGMAADDDGVSEAFTVMRTTGASRRDLNALEEQGFVRVLNDELVTLILAWRQNNHVRADRYKPGMHRELLEQAGLADNVGCADGNQAVDARSTQVRLGKDRLGKVSGGSAAGRGCFTPPTLEELTDYIREGNYEVDPEYFFDYHEAQGWQVGNHTMRNWQAAVRRWHRQNLARRREEPPRYGGEGDVANLDELYD